MHAYIVDAIYDSVKQFTLRNSISCFRYLSIVQLFFSIYLVSEPHLNSWFTQNSRWGRGRFSIWDDYANISQNISEKCYAKRSLKITTKLDKSTTKSRILYDYQERSSRQYFKQIIVWPKFHDKNSSALYRLFDRFLATILKERPTQVLYLHIVNN